MAKQRDSLHVLQKFSYFVRCHPRFDNPCKSVAEKFKMRGTGNLHFYANSDNVKAKKQAIGG